MPCPLNPEIRCATCLFFSENDMVDDGYCHRFPPSHRADPDYVQPAVWETDWCGEWRSKSDPRISIRDLF